MLYVVFIGFVVLFVGTIFGVNLMLSRQANEAWSRAARTLGLRAKPGGFLKRREIDGDRGGFRVKLDTYTVRSGKNSTTYTRFRLWFPRRLGLGLQLTKEGFWAGVTKFFGAQDIAVGDAGFDGQVLVKGSDPERVRRWLTPARRLRVRHYLEAYSGAHIDDEGVRWEVRGVIRDARRIVTGIDAMVRLAGHLCEEREDDRDMDRALEAHVQGHPEAALRILQETHDRPRKPGDPIVRHVEEHLLEGELLYLGDRREEAKSVFARAHDEAPDDPEVSQWAARVEGEEAASAKAQKTLPSTDPSTPAAPAAGETLDQASVCRALFEEQTSNFAATRVFEDRYEGKTVRWSGPLEKIEPYHFDFVFQGDQGVKATVAIHQTSAELFGSSAVEALVQLPADAEKRAGELVGETVAFTGRLKKVDGFMRKLYVADGTLDVAP